MAHQDLENKYVKVPLGLTLVDAMDLFISKVFRACNYNEEFTAYCLDITIEEFLGFIDDEDEGEEDDI